MGGHDYWGQAKFWSRELPRRAQRSLVRSISPSLNHKVVRALEGQARPRDLNLYTTFPRVREILVQTREESPPILSRIPALPGQLDEDAFWYPPVRVHELRNVMLDVESGLVFSRDWVVNGTGTGHRWAMDSAFITGATVRVRRGAAVSWDRPVAPLGNAVERYHFMLEALPQILRIHRSTPDVTFVTAEEPFDFAREILTKLGVRYEVVPAGSVLACQRVWTCEGFPRDRTHPSDVQMIHDTFVGLFAESGRRTASRIYVSRARSWRSLRDESALERFLEERGFAVVYLEELTLADQVRTLNAADVVVSPHGAGLANVAFMKPGGRVIEIATGECWTNAYRRLAYAREADYHLVMLDTVDDSEFGTGDGLVAIERLRTMLGDLGIA